MSFQMKIAIGKFGKSILFDRSKWGATGGDNEPPVLYETLFHKNPNIQFYLIGLSDYSRLPVSEQNRINKYGNVIDPWKDKPLWRKNNKNFGKDLVNIEYLRYWTESNPEIIKSISWGLFFLGPMGISNVLGKTTLMKEPNKLSGALVMCAKYAGPLAEFLNTTQLPWIGIVNDPRYVPPRAKDLMNPPRAILSQYNELVNFKYRQSYTDNTVLSQPIQCDYASMETIFLIGRDREESTIDTSSLDDFLFTREEKESNEKNIKFMIVCNEGDPSRYPTLKSYILDHINDVEIYGQWKESTIGDDPRFKGPKKFHDLQSMLHHVKYTFCIPIKKGWATAKFWEMLNYDIIPFVHPSYDEQNNIGFPEILRVKDSKDLFNKIEYLENHPDDYQRLLKQLKNLIKPEYHSGDYLNELILKRLSTIR